MCDDTAAQTHITSEQPHRPGERHEHRTPRLCSVCVRLQERDEIGALRLLLQTFNNIRQFSIILVYVSSKMARKMGHNIPANTILVPGMYFFGSKRYSNRVSSLQVMALFLLASVYVKLQNKKNQLNMRGNI